jgi:hypothetical protein
MNKRIYLVASLALLTGTAHATQFDGLIGAEGLRFSTGASGARVSVAVSQPTQEARQQRVGVVEKETRHDDCAAALRMCDGTSKSPSHPRSRGD